jgi:hypothetical protein
MSSLRIVTTPDVDSTQRVQLSGSSYSLRIVWSQRGRCFRMSVSDSAGVPLVLGVRMVTLYPLLDRYHYDKRLPPGDIWFLDMRDQGAKPTLAEMGDRFRLYYVTDDTW